MTKTWIGGRKREKKNSYRTIEPKERLEEKVTPKAVSIKQLEDCHKLPELDLHGRCDEKESYNADIQLGAGKTLTFDYGSPDSKNPHPRYDPNISEIPCSNSVVSFSSHEPKTQLCNDEDEEDVCGISQNSQPEDMKPFTYLSPVTKSSSRMEAELSETNSPRK